MAMQASTVDERPGDCSFEASFVSAWPRSGAQRAVNRAGDLLARAG
jgi:hypothetical protein